MANRFLVCALAAVALGGCGETGNNDIGARPGADGVRDVVPVYATALAEGDGPRACSLMSTPAQDELERRTKSADCPQAVSSVAKGLDKQAADGLRKLKLGEPRVDGQTATVDVELAAAGREAAVKALGSTQLKLVQVDTRWHIDTGQATS